MGRTRPRDSGGQDERRGVTLAALLPARRALLAMWLTAAVGFGLLLVLARGASGPLDDPDPAYQRPGILDLGALPTPAPQVTADIPAPGRRAVVFFERPERLQRLCRALQADPLAQDVDVVVMVSGEGGRCPGDTTVVVDPAAALARRFGLEAPRGGGTPVGYAVVDSYQRIRYRTLDPHTADGLDEVATMVEAAP